ncbi:glycosyltransferase family 8 protein [Boletus edulis BED1]|uniref:Glycosyltransferase family 8 protein n=1 Tax=Boletus edulis BED1 TaxID=1328754 RepID=A0AAD4C1M9_BOLED|nr:glycosyltransferase family 8 protein [Boletus edulis BED1]
MGVKAAYATLLTNTSYLPGVLVLEYTLRAVGSEYSLVVMATPALPPQARGILARRGVRVIDIQPLHPPAGLHTLSRHDARFTDTWAKLRVFELTGYDRIVLLDADMIVMQNMDELIHLPLERDEIAATHACACNPQKLKHYPIDWVPENCAYTPLSHPTGLMTPTQITGGSPRPHSLLNSGLVVLNPSTELAQAVYDHLYTSPLVPAWSFPDQDLLADCFKGKWKPLPWCYNALKTLMLIHKPLWRDEEVRCLHYILADKPWHARVSKEGGGEYDKAHQWWWDRLELLGAEMRKSNSEDWNVIMANVVQV